MIYDLIHQISEFDLEPNQFWTKRQIDIYEDTFFDQLDEQLTILADQNGLSARTFSRHMLEIFYCAELRPADMDPEEFQSVVGEVIPEAIRHAEDAAVTAAYKYAEDNEAEWHRDYHREIWEGESDDCDICK
ncbi:MAG: hypothetical protein CV090_09090 [Nitrospira sp. WS238]|nr:hypothetical protein [Nitrospira sp. WS238]